METKTITKYKCGLCGKEEIFEGYKGSDIWGKFCIGDDVGYFYFHSKYRIDVCPECAKKVFKYSNQKNIQEEIKTAWEWFKEKMGLQ